MVMLDVGHGGGCVVGGRVLLWEISVPSSQFCCESKIALQNSFLKRVTPKNKINEVAQTDQDDLCMANTCTTLWSPFSPPLTTIIPQAKSQTQRSHKD